MNGTDGANGFAGDMKTPEKLGMSLISPTPMNSPVNSNPHWYASMSGAGDAMASRDMWQQQQLPLAEGMSRTAEVPCVSAENGAGQEGVSVTERAEDRGDVSDASPKDVDASETPAETGAATETVTVSAETGTPAETGSPCSVPLASIREVSEGDATPRVGDGPAAPSKGVVSQSSDDKQTDAQNSSDLSVASADEDITESESSVDTQVSSGDTQATKCTSPDSSDTATGPSGGGETSHRDGEASECRNGTYAVYVMSCYLLFMEFSGNLCNLNICNLKFSDSLPSSLTNFYSST